MVCRSVLCVAILVLAIPCGAYGEDFATHLDELAKVDADRPLPLFEIENMLDAGKSESASRGKTLVRIYDVRMKIDGYGTVRLAEYREDSPVTEDGSDSGGRSWRCGLVRDNYPVVAGWLEGSPDLLVVGWTVSPNMRGTHLTFWHGSVVLHLADGKVLEVVRRATSCSYNAYWAKYDNGCGSLYYEYDAGRGMLVEHLKRWTMALSESKLPMYYVGPVTSDEKCYIAHISEEVVTKYAYGDGNLGVSSIELFYTSQKGDTSKDIVAFYLGPVASRDLILEANPGLTDVAGKPARFHSELPEGTRLKIPVPTDWLLRRYGPRR